MPSNKKLIIAAVAAGVLWYLFKNTPTAEAASLPSGSAYSAAPQFNPDYSTSSMAAKSETLAPAPAPAPPAPKPWNFFSGYQAPHGGGGSGHASGYRLNLE